MNLKIAALLSGQTHCCDELLFPCVDKIQNSVRELGSMCVTDTTLTVTQVS